MNYYARHLGDYAAEAGFLSVLEHGVYTLMLDWYYKNERPIPKELAYQICKATSRSEKQAAIKVLDTFFNWNPDRGWEHKQAEAAIATMREKSAKARNSSQRRWGRTQT
jgi:uncharacterized protein YdaU (DUF1376 family)